MGFLIVDASKCRKDGYCAKECPMAIIHLRTAEGYPEMVPGGEQHCTQCGHCVAVCPHGALSHTLVPLESCPSIREELTIGEAQAVQFLRSRRSIRSFLKDRPVEEETITKLIEIARYAPTGSNSQMVEWTVFRDKQKIKELSRLTVDWMRLVLQKDPQPAYAPYMPMIVAVWDAGHDIVLRDAPVVVVASAPKTDPNGLVDVTLALSYFELAATSMGLGTCWAGLAQGAILSSPQLKKEMGIPEDHPHHYPMMLGYPKPRYFRVPERRAPKIRWK
ncbi:MAG: 4Fe-4S dicluster domain-containing protein [Deltaproteobacteria bacterium]|nr:4Fe-4S dicluster domain-containing protein [Deltaproteobacteria bacterium]